MDEGWQSVKQHLQRCLSKGQYELWVCTLDYLGCETDRLILGCRNRFHIEWLREKLEEKLLAAARQHFPGVAKIDYRIETERQKTPVESAQEGPRQINFHELIRKSEPAFNPRFTFDQFVVGQCNQFAYSATMALAGEQGYNNQSVYLLSPTGLGKSHLAHAVGHHLTGLRPNCRVRYTTTEQFANEMIFALQHGSIENFKNKFRNGCDVLLLERIDFLSGKDKVQNELVYTLDELMDRGKRVLCTGNSLPRDIPRLSSELKSRLHGGLVAPIDPPDFRTRTEIIRRKSQGEAARFPQEVIEFLAERMTGDVRQMESCIHGLSAKSHILKIPITVKLAEDVTLAMLNNLPQITIEHIQQIICSSFQVSVDDLRSPSRRQELAAARKIAMYLCRQYTTESLQTIGKSFKRAHSTVLHAVNGLAKQLEDKNGKWKRQVDYVSRKIETSCLTL
jgi:chromosomal replication initiator protein